MQQYTTYMIIIRVLQYYSIQHYSISVFQYTVSQYTALQIKPKHNGCR